VGAIAAAEAYELDLLDHADLPGLVAHAWSDAEYPEQYCSVTSGGRCSTRLASPSTACPLTVPPSRCGCSEAAKPRNRRGWSWTADLAQARWFAIGKLRGRLVGRVCTLLARRSATHDREEAEHEVDTKGLPIAETNERP
jgi:hypothetical protein